MCGAVALSLKMTRYDLNQRRLASSASHLETRLMATARKSFEAILLDRSWVSAQDLDKARQRKKPGQELADVLVEMGALEPQRLARALAQEYRLPFQAHIDEHSLDTALVAKIPINYAKKNRLLPLSSERRHGDRRDRRSGQLRAARRSARPVRRADTMPLVAPAEVIAEAINRAYDQASATTAEDLMIDLEEERLDVVANELASEPRTCSSPTTRRRSSSWSTACCRRRSRTARATSTSKFSSGNWWCASAWTACCTTCCRRPSAFSRRSLRASRSWRASISRRSGCRRTARIRLRIAGRDIDIARLDRSRPRSASASCCDCSIARRRSVDINLDHLGFSGDNLQRLDRLIQAEPRHHPGDRADRIGQIDDAVRVSVAESTRPKRTSSRSRIRSSISCAASARCR